MSIAIVYNPACLDSINAAAIIFNVLAAKKQKPVEAIASPGLMVAKSYDEYYWVGVKPNPATVEHYSKAINRGIFIELHPKDDQYLDWEFEYISTWEQVSAFLEPMWEGTGVRVPKTLTTIASVVYMEECELHSYWRLFQMVSDFMNDRQMSLLSQALLWDNTGYARAMLEASSAHTTVGTRVIQPYRPCVDVDEQRGQQLVRDYLQFMKAVKRDISEVVEYRTIVSQSKRVIFPVMNLGPENTPWVMRIVSATYPAAVVYDNRRGWSLYAVWGLERHYQETLAEEITLKHNKNQDRKRCFYDHV